MQIKQIAHPGGEHGGGTKNTQNRQGFKTFQVSSVKLMCFPHMEQKLPKEYSQHPLSSWASSQKVPVCARMCVLANQ